MHCLRCGREVPSGKVFCEDCLIHSQKYPVSPNASYTLPPRRQSPPVRKPPKKRVVPLEEQIHTLQRRLRFSILWSLAATLLALALAVPAARYLLEDHFELGQNYSTFTTQTTEATEPDPTVSGSDVPA